MDIVTGLIGFALGAILARLAIYRSKDIEAEQAAKQAGEDHEREVKLAFLNGYMFRYRKEKEHQKSTE